jgi:nucleoside-diphosphate-sugar epimerase
MADRILVTGANGFIGTHLVSALRAAGHDVLGLSHRDGDIATCDLPGDGLAHVFHLAARTFVPLSWTTPAAYYATNVLGTVNVLECCRRAGVALTFVSSYVYGRPQRLPIDEDHPLDALNPYSDTKIVGERLVASYGRLFGVPGTIVRPFNVYGPGQRPPFLIPQIVEQALDARRACIEVKDLRPRRDYLYVSDLVALLVATLTPGGCGTYNAGSGQSISVAEVLDAVRRDVGTDKPIRASDESRVNEVMDVVADVSLARRQLQWQPLVGFEEGLSRTVDWVRSCGVPVS